MQRMISNVFHFSWINSKSVELSLWLSPILYICSALSDIFNIWWRNVSGVECRYSSLSCSWWPLFFLNLCLYILDCKRPILHSYISYGIGPVAAECRLAAIHLTPPFKMINCGIALPFISCTHTQLFWNSLVLLLDWVSWKLFSFLNRLFQLCAAN